MFSVFGIWNIKMITHIDIKMSYFPLYNAVDMTFIPKEVTSKPRL